MTGGLISPGKVLKTSYANLAIRLPEIKNYEYDFNRGQFKKRGAKGRGEADLTSLAASAELAGLGTRAGVKTLKRAIITDTISRTPVRERSRLLQQISGKLQNNLPRSLEDVSYSLEDDLNRKRKPSKRTDDPVLDEALRRAGGLFAYCFFWWDFGYVFFTGFLTEWGKSS